MTPCVAVKTVDFFSICIPPFRCVDIINVE
jgi:hypothetical protein